MSKYKIKLNTPLIDLEGKDQEITIGKALSTHLIAANEGDALKMYDWALNLSRGNDLELDQSDYETFKSFVKNCKTANVLLKGQVLKNINDLKAE